MKNFGHLVAVLLGCSILTGGCSGAAVETESVEAELAANLAGYECVRSHTVASPYGDIGVCYRGWIGDCQYYEHYYESMAVLDLHSATMPDYFERLYSGQSSQGYAQLNVRFCVPSQ